MDHKPKKSPTDWSVNRNFYWKEQQGSKKKFAGSTERNRDFILTVLKERLHHKGTVLEIGSGTGQHAVYFAENLPHITWQPSDPDPEARKSIKAWSKKAALSNLKDPIDLEVGQNLWPIEKAEAVVTINMIHIAPWNACRALLNGAARVLSKGGLLMFYGPFFRKDHLNAPGNISFDLTLRSRNSQWGVRDLEKVTAAAKKAGFHLTQTIDMPANNLTVIFRKK